ncbi:hypothetical protein [Actinomadura rifamycini]|uniref:hypothetical protein n=1 Tax=Actinomadura rifamycini TaxID=31962 RepID=UPI0003FEE17A|nr:hypothetical protein [Actinomadura rifamycini]
MGSTAYCRGRYDEMSAVDEFEPVGPHPGFRRAVVRAACVVVLHAFAAASSTHAVTRFPGSLGGCESKGSTAYT